jgi:hypothetical protein
MKVARLEGHRVRLKNRRVGLMVRPGDGAQLVFRSLQAGRNIGPTAICSIKRFGNRTVVDAVLNLSDEAVAALASLCMNYLKGKAKYTLAS